MADLQLNTYFCGLHKSFYFKSIKGKTLVVKIDLQSINNLSSFIFLDEFCCWQPFVADKGVLVNGMWACLKLSEAHEKLIAPFSTK